MMPATSSRKMPPGGLYTPLRHGPMPVAILAADQARWPRRRRRIVRPPDRSAASAQPRGDVAQVAQRGRQMADLDVGVRAAIVAHRREKIAMVRQAHARVLAGFRAACSSGRRASSRPPCPTAASPRCRRRRCRFRTLPGGRDDQIRCSKMSCLRCPTLAVARIFEHDVLRVGKLLIVVEEVLAARRP